MIFHYVKAGRKVGSHDPFPRTGASDSDAAVVVIVIVLFVFTIVSP